MRTCFEFRNAADEQLREQRWKDIVAATDHSKGLVFLADETIHQIGRLISGVLLANGKTASVYDCSEEEVARNILSNNEIGVKYIDNYPVPVFNQPQGACIGSFGPSLLPTEIQDRVRDILAQDKNGATAVTVFNDVLRFGFQIRLEDDGYIDGHMQVVDRFADDYSMHRSRSDMLRMMDDLGLGDTTNENRRGGEVELDRFSAAVAENGGGFARLVKIRLAAFIACAQRNNATHLYWY